MSTLLLRIELFDGGATTKWRPFVSAEHTALCAAAGLDPVRHYFDVPESFKRVGAGSARIEGRKIDGYIMRAGVDRPVGKLTLAYEGERFRDDDPRDVRDRERLG